MAGEYAVLAPIYDAIGLSSFAPTATGQVVNYAIQRGWMGRSILDLGCGTGSSSLWAKQHGYNIAAVDSSPEMLRVARQSFLTGALNAQFYEQDIRQLDLDQTYDLALALNVLNELDSLRDLEATFKSVARVVRAEQLFAFDLQTLEGLARESNADQILYDSPTNLTVLTRSTYEYERQMRTTQYLIFQQPNRESGWQRQTTQQTLRAYPVQAVATLLQRTGFEVVSVLTTALTPYEPNTPGVDRVFFVAKRV